MLQFRSLFQIINIPQPGIPEVVLPLPIQALRSGKGGEIDVIYNRCIEGLEPEVFELWDFAEDGICEVHPYARVQISDDFVGETFYSHFFNTREIRIPFLGRRSVNRSVQWLDLTRPFGKTGTITTVWTENTFVYGWGTNPTVIPNCPNRRCTTFQSVPINLCAFSYRANYNRLRRICVEWRKSIERELHAQILLDISDEVLSDDSDDGWLEESNL